MGVAGGIPQRSALGSLLYVHIDDMPLQVWDGYLLQVADDTCLICSGDTPNIAAQAIDDICVY